MQCVDQLKRILDIPFPPRRIVSLVPSQTELLADLGLDEELKGITRYCIHPRQLLTSKQIIGGTKQLRLDRIAQLQPDLILANKEENRAEDIEILSRDYPVWVSDIDNLNSALDMIRSVGVLCGKTEKANLLANKIEQEFTALRPDPIPTAIYLIWKKPIMVAGGQTFINDCLTRAGFRNLLAHQNRYPEIHLEAIRDMSPDFIFLSSEPYPFGIRHVKAFQELFSSSAVHLVDGEMFSWYGSRMLKAPNYYKTLREKIL